MKQSDFYRAMVAGMIAIALAVGFNGYATWTAKDSAQKVVECTSVYYTEAGFRAGTTAGRVHHTCFNRDGAIIEVGTSGFTHSFSSDESVTGDPRFPPLGEG